MKKFYSKNKGFILLQVILISFLFLSLTLIIQLLLDSRFELYKLNEKSQAFIAKANFLDEIIKQEFKNIENKINNKEISCVEDLIHKNNFDERIYLPSCKEKISKFGYTILKEKNNKTLEERLKKTFTSTFVINYQKEIKIENKTYYIRATVKYKIIGSKNLNNLGDGTLKRMWILENV